MCFTPALNRAPSVPFVAALARRIEEDDVGLRQPPHARRLPQDRVDAPGQKLRAAGHAVEPRVLLRLAHRIRIFLNTHDARAGANEEERERSRTRVKVDHALDSGEPRPEAGEDLADHLAVDLEE
jgi:hypothetical protein